MLVFLTSIFSNREEIASPAFWEEDPVSGLLLQAMFSIAIGIVVGAIEVITENWENAGERPENANQED